MAGKPYQSCLIPYEDEIIALRRKRPPMPYSQIADLLREKYQVMVCRENIFYFIKLRVKKGYKPCKYDAWDIEPKNTNVNNQPTTEMPSSQKQTNTQMPKPPISTYPKSTVKPDSPTGKKQPKRFEYEYSTNYNLTRLTPEEAEAYTKQLEKEQENE